jgi:phage tail sheath protein FI
MADNATFDITADGRFFARTRVDRYESNIEISRVRRLIPAAFPGSSASSTFTLASSTFVGKGIRTSATNTKRSGAAAGVQSYANIELGLVRSVEAGTFIKVTLAQANPYLKGVPNNQFSTPVLQGKNITLNRTGLAATVIGTFDGYAKVWNTATDQYETDLQSFYIRLNTAGTGLTFATTGSDVLSMSAIAGGIVTTTQMIKGYIYTINTAGTTNFTTLGAISNNPGTTFTYNGVKTGLGNGSVRTIATVGAIRRVEKVEVLNMATNNKAEAIDAVCDREWRYSKEFTRVPGTSTYAEAAGGANDEVHMLLIDTTGVITGAAGTIIQKWEGASKAVDAKASNGTSSYYKNLINNSGWIWWLDHPDTADIGGRANWGSVAKNNNFDALANNPDVTLAGGDDGDALTESNIMDAYEMFNDASAYDISLMPTGNVSANTAAWIIENIAAVRKDVVAFVSAPLLIGTASDIATEMVQYRNSIDVGDATASYGVMDSGWKYQYDRYNDVFRWIPLNGDVAGLCAYTDNVSDAWFSPGGFNRGQIKNVTKLAFNPTQAQRDLLYVGGINPVVTFPGEGTILYGDKTMQKKSSAFDRINVRRLFIVLEKAVANAAKYQLFEFNDDFTRAQFKNLVEPFLRDVQGRRGIVDFRVKCDTTNNTPAVIDANEFIADIYIKPNRSINYITLNFIATKTGVSFETVGL